MTIEKGQDWGSPGPLAPDAPVFGDDRSASVALAAALERGEPLSEFGLLGGDLHRSLGAPAHDEAALRQGHGTRFPIDVGVVELDGRREVFIAHLVATEHASGRLWAGPTWVIVNGSFVGPYDLGPRAHPNDGRLDLTTGALPLGQRRAGRRRARTGTHLPHPDLTTRRVAELEIDHPGGLHVRLDGAAAQRVQALSVHCRADAVTVVV